MSRDRIAIRRFAGVSNPLAVIPRLTVRARDSVSPVSLSLYLSLALCPYFSSYLVRNYSTDLPASCNDDGTTPVARRLEIYSRNSVASAPVAP